MSKLKSAVDQADASLETRVYTRRQCILSTESVDREQRFFAALAAILVPAFIERGLGNVSAALRKAGTPETLRDFGKFPTYLYQLSKDKNDKTTLSLNPNLGCVIIVRGKFRHPDPDTQPEMNFPKEGSFLDISQEPQRIERLNANGIPVETIAVVYEAAIKTTFNATALYYESRFLEVNQFQGSRSSKTRTIVVGITINGVGKTEGGLVLSSALMNLGEIKKGSILGPKQFKNSRSGWLGGLELSKEALLAIKEIDIPRETTREIAPATIEAMLSETEDGNKALIFIADILDATKPKLTEAISSEILPGPREEREKEEADALEILRQEEETAYTNYLKAEKEKAALSESATDQEKALKKFEVEKTKRVWCVKYKVLEKIGIPPASRICSN